MMGDNDGRRVRFSERRASRDQFIPSAAWTEDSFNHLLLIDLPGFKMEEAKLQVEKSGEITVSGERLVNDNKYLYFEKTFKAPQNSDVEKVTGKFEGDILYVKVPKQATQFERKIPTSKSNIEEKSNMIVEEKQLGDIVYQNQQVLKDDDNKDKKQESKSNSDCTEGFKKEEIGKWDGQISMLERATFIVRKNSHVLLTIALAFSLGVFIGNRFSTVNVEKSKKNSERDN